MKKFIKPFIIVMSVVLLSSCGANNHLTSNLNLTSANVELSKNNFKVIQKVTAQVETSYIFGFGGISKKALAEMAKAKLYEDADLEGKSRAIINYTIEEHITMYTPIYVIRTVTVSGYVVEFTN